MPCLTYLLIYDCPHALVYFLLFVPLIQQPAKTHTYMHTCIEKTKLCYDIKPHERNVEKRKMYNIFFEGEKG